ncbi:MAG: hypothetical protein FJY65_08305 [Calditrichaeota bacterium]|nr:hypothetical protein [Calditrichota bacterium]
MKPLVLLTLVITTIFLSGCGSTLQVDRGTVQTIAMLDKEQYEITGEVAGEAIVSWVFFFIPLGDKPQRGVLYNPAMICPFGQPGGPVEGMAIYNAIEKSPGVDMIVAPRFESEITGFPPLFWTVKVKVKGKGLKLK